MNTKTIMTLAVAGALATASFADEAFDNLVKLARTPKEQITAANAAQILDAAIATTNTSAPYRLIDSKTVTYAQLFEKMKSNQLWFSTLNFIGAKNGTDAEKVTAFQNFVESWIALDDEEAQDKYIPVFSRWAVMSWKDKVLMAPSEIEVACAKVAGSSSKLKANALASMLYIYGKGYWDGRLNALCEQHFDIVKNAILDGSFKPCFKEFDFANYVVSTRQDYALTAQLLNNIKWFEPYGANTKSRCPYLAGVYKHYEPTLSGLRKQYLASVAENDFQLTTVALAQDKTDGNKKTTESIYSKLTGIQAKLETALYLKDDGKLVDVLMTIDNSIAPELIDSAVAQINTFDPDYRAADVLKALRVINKKYTLKLYDDRDTWEPILSKVRALIDTYNN